MAECVAYGIPGTNPAEGRQDIPVSQCLAYRAFEGQLMREDEDNSYEALDRVYEP